MMSPSPAIMEYWFFLFLWHSSDEGRS